MEDAQKWLKPQYIATLMDVSVDTILKMAHSGELEAVKFGGQVRISQQSLLHYLEQHRICVEKGTIMKQCQFCNATFESLDAYQIHLGVGAPAFHACNDAGEMLQKGMTQNQAGEWTIDENLIEHRDNWAYLSQPLL